MTTIPTPTADLEHTIAAGGSVRIETLETEVRLRAVDGRVARVRLANADLATEFRVEAAADRLRIRPARRWTFGWRRLRGPLDVDVPRDVRVDVETASGSVLALDIVGGLGVRTASGDAELAGVGGDVAVNTVSGASRLQAEATVALELGSVSGRIDAAAASVSSVRARSTSGQIRLMARLHGSGPFSLETVSGDITLGTDGPLRLRASTVSGEVSPDVGGSDLVRGRTFATTGSGPEVNVRTISGHIRLADWQATADGSSAGAAAPAGGGAVPSGDPTVAADAAPGPAEADAPGVRSPVPGPQVADPSDPPSDDVEELRLGVLRALAQGEISVAEAGRRIDALEEGSR